MSNLSPNEPSARELDDELLSAYVDNELDVRERAAVEQRLRTDERARRLVDELRAASETVQALPREQLGRDLRGIVMAQIERSAIEPAAVLAMPEKGGARRSAGRGWAWAAVAIAAGLLLMVALPRGDREDRPVAQVSTDKSEPEVEREMREAAPAGPAGGVGGELTDLHADAPAAAPATAPAEAPAGAVATAPPVPQSASEGNVAESRVALQSAAGEPMRARGGGAAVAAGGRNAQRPEDLESVDEAVNLRDNLAQEQLPRFEVAAKDAARFEQLLTEHNILLREDAAPADGAEALAEVVGDEESPVDAVLVEGTQEQIDAVIAALKAKDDAETSRVEKKASLDFAADARRAGAAPGVAWRLTRRGLAAASDPAEADAPSVARETAGADRYAAAPPRVRVIFVLLPAEDAGNAAR